MKGNRILVGNRPFIDRDILSGNCYIGNSIAADELSIDTLKFVSTVHDVMRFVPKGASGMMTADGNLFVLATSGKPVDLVSYVYGTPCYYYHDDDLIGKFYLENVIRISKNNYEITCTSAIGLLDRSLHYGGVYVGTKMSAVVDSIIGKTVPYTISREFKSMPIYGWLPVATRRENLHQLLFAAGASMRKSTAGAIEIGPLENDTPKRIPDSRLYMGGSIDLSTPVSRVAITEHTFSARAGDERVTLHDGDVPSDTTVSPNGTTYTGAIITFDAPMHNLSISNGTILESGVNYAVLAQSGSCTLTGQKYTHTMREVVKNAKDQAALSARMVDVKENVARVEHATLVSLANVENVADRVLAYYSMSKAVTVEMVMGAERPGDAVVFNDPFDEETLAFVKSQDISFGNTLRASAVMVSGYTPTENGNFYNSVAVLSGAGTWVVPAKVRKIHAVLIGCGRRGPNGNAGGRGQQGGSSTLPPDIMGTAYCRHPGTGGAGGSGATTGGSGGDIYEIEFAVSAGQSISYNSGSGGDGQATSFGSYSSANGNPRASGFSELFSGELYAAKGDVPGKPGGSGTGAANTSDPYAYIIQGETVVGMDGARYYPGSQGTGAWVCNGGYGGGAAAGRNGGSGYSASERGSGTPGDGGSGATPLAPAAKSKIGDGGDGGHGGGGGGGNGDSRAYKSYTNMASPGYGGSGGQGGLGGPGGVIVYY